MDSYETVYTTLGCNYHTGYFVCWTNLLSIKYKVTAFLMAKKGEGGGQTAT